MKNKNGFTLIELLAVIIILGVLMLVAIPSVTKYIDNSRKQSYIDTAKQYIKGATNLVNSAALDTYDTETTYYIPSSCINLETGGQSPYGGEFSPAYILVTYDNESFNYYWMSTDNQKMGIKTPTSSDRLDINLVETGVTSNDVQPIIGIDGRSTIVEYTGDCSSVKATTISTKLINGKTGEEAKEAANIIKTKSDIIYLADAYRYIGSNPNNYVYFNNEIWRIIGVYNNKLKIINTDNEHSIQYNTYDKQWMNDWDDSTVNDWLKNDYYNSLSSIAKEMIEPSSWYIGKANGGENAEEAYNKSKVLTWNGTVGTIAAYEFLYASSPSSCYSISGHNYSGGAYCGRNWIASRSISITMTAYENDQHLACFLYGGNYPSIGVSGVQNHLTVRPVVYLKPSVKILDGEGTNTNPYRLAQ